jgi:hypothetical protein
MPERRNRLTSMTFQSFQPVISAVTPKMAAMVGVDDVTSLAHMDSTQMGMAPAGPGLL